MIFGKEPLNLDRFNAFVNGEEGEWPDFWVEARRSVHFPLWVRGMLVADAARRSERGLFSN